MIDLIGVLALLIFFFVGFILDDLDTFAAAIFTILE